MQTYRPSEALNGLMTARDFITRFATGVLELMPDPDVGIEEMTAEGHAEARKLGLPYSASGQYAPVVWELAWTKAI